MTQCAQEWSEIYLLRLLLILYEDEDSELKTEIYHTDMKYILKHMSFIMNLDYIINCFCDIALEKAGWTEVLIICADGHLYLCYLILAGLSVDYKEQILIIEIKYLHYCIICQIFFNQRYNLCSLKYPF